MKLGAPLALLIVATTAHAEPIVLKLNTVAPADSPWAKALAEFKRGVESAHPGRVRIKLHVAAPDEDELLQTLRRGQAQAFAGSAAAVATLVPELNVLELPYLVQSYEEADYVIDDLAAPALKKAFADHGLVAGAWSESGFRNFGTTFAVVGPAALKGKKLRSQDNAIHLELYRALSATPVPLGISDTLAALQSHAVEGYDQTPLFTLAASWHTAITHYTLSEHIYESAVVVYDKAFYDALPSEIRATMTVLGNTLSRSMRTKVRAMTPELLEHMKAAHVQVSVLHPAQRAELQKIGQKVRDEWAKKASASDRQLLAAIEDGLRARRQRPPVVERITP
jgi:TRAP-type C4-dicarboxylate transport system substrate-binding protein